ncbi:hypothetical protein NL500_30640, partial [Klebsiella pneumoniae]|nr:hypothetical protein [Klebsiella pneumoniae]
QPTQPIYIINNYIDNDNTNVIIFSDGQRVDIPCDANGNAVVIIGYNHDVKGNVILQCADNTRIIVPCRKPDTPKVTIPMIP